MFVNPATKDLHGHGADFEVSANLGLLHDDILHYDAIPGLPGGSCPNPV